MIETEKTGINWCSTVDFSGINRKDIGLNLLDESTQMGHKKKGWRRLGHGESCDLNMTEAKPGKRKFNFEEEIALGPDDVEGIKKHIGRSANERAHNLASKGLKTGENASLDRRSADEEITEAEIDRGWRGRM
ncbi:hypothetical protein PVK06_025572 [Gossypium arboreum]|uniref:Uncharacterized protein n=1 Tax=Gossypium arboreum TaxID=29729 RepID=A0ABR0PH82_GOSAR|nr:hypothetical protein PVK06_025572 [Gossypium arboreum]